jgi:major structural subunit of bundle-forming pilus
VKRRLKGLTIIESALVLAVGTLVAAGVFVFYGDMTTNAKTQRTVSDLRIIETSIRSIFDAQGSYEQLSIENVVRSNILPNRMVVSNTELVNTFNGNISINPVTISTPNNGFEIEMTDIPVKACYQLSVQDYGSILHELHINGVNLPVPTVPLLATAQCNQPGTDLVNIK